MALTYNEKIAIAKLKAEGLSAYAIFNKLSTAYQTLFFSLNPLAHHSDLCYNTH